MKITHYYPIFGEDLQFDNQTEIRSNKQDILAVIDTYPYSENEDDMNYLAFSTDNGDTFEVQKVNDNYSGSLRVIVEKKILWLFPLRYDKMHGFNNVSRFEMEHFLAMYLQHTPEQILKRIDLKSF